MEIITKDSSFTFFNEDFGEYYHSVQDGALKETLHKHILPSFSYTAKKNLKVLDICFGLGYNTLGLIQHAKEEKRALEIHSPEMDKNLLKVLPQCPYPQGFNKTILKALLQTCHYKDKDVEVFLHLGDAREVLRQINGGFDIVFQDAFSPRKNKQLWTYEYFKDIFRITSKDCIITTYSQNSSMLYSAFLAGFKPYLLKQKEVRDSVIFTKSDKEPSLKIENVFTLRPINMLHKISVNSNLMGLYDE